MHQMIKERKSKLLYFEKKNYLNFVLLYYKVEGILNTLHTNKVNI